MPQPLQMVQPDLSGRCLPEKGGQVKSSSALSRNLLLSCHAWQARDAPLSAPFPRRGFGLGPRGSFSTER